MRIDNNRASLDAAGAAHAAKAAEATAAKGARAEAGKTDDRVRLSAGVRLLSTAASAATASPDVRPEAVARARALLASGELGANPERLADALIDRALAGRE